MTATAATINEGHPCDGIAGAGDYQGLGLVDKSPAWPRNSPRGSVQLIIGDSYLVASSTSGTGSGTQLEGTLKYHCDLRPASLE